MAETIGKYEVVATLGRGSMGVVYKAQDPMIGRLVAIKTLRSVFLGDDAQGTEALKRFQQESRSAGCLRHPNIVTIFEAGRSDEGSPYIVMDFIEGQSLEQIIAEKSPLHPAEALHYLAQVASAIDYAHSQNVIHRDIKPSNVIVGLDHMPHLLDFGVAKLSDTSLTPAGTVVGTPSYMSPEQIRGEQLDGGTDIFAFGVMAYELFIGKRPFPGKDFTTVVNNIIHKEPLAFAEVGCAYPAELANVLSRAMAKERTERYKNALEFVNEAGKVFDIVLDGTGVVGGYDPDNLDESHSFDGKGGVDSSSGDSDSDQTQIAHHIPEPQANESVAKDLGDWPSSDSGSAPPQFADKSSSGFFAMIGLFGVVLAAGYLYVSGGLEPLVSSISQVAPVQEDNDDVDVFSGLEEVASKGESFAQEQLALAPTQEDSEIEILPPSKKKSAQAPDNSLVAPSQVVEKKAAEMKVVKDDEFVEKAPDIDVVESAGSQGEPNSPVFKVDPILVSIEQLPDLSDVDLQAVILHKSVSQEIVRKALGEASKRSSVASTRAILGAVTHENFLVRIESMKALSVAPHKGRPLAILAVEKALKDQDFLVRGFAAKTLGKIGNKGSLSAVNASLAVESNERVRKVLTQAATRLEKL